MAWYIKALNIRGNWRGWSVFRWISLKTAAFPFYINQGHPHKLITNSMREEGEKGQLESEDFLQNSHKTSGVYSRNTCGELNSGNLFYLIHKQMVHFHNYTHQYLPHIRQFMYDSKKSMTGSHLHYWRIMKAPAQSNIVIVKI